MDTGRQTRKFPACTIPQLKDALRAYEAGTHPCGTPAPGHLEAIAAEIERRESGLSVCRPTPQMAPLAGTAPVGRVGRM